MEDFDEEMKGKRKEMIERKRSKEEEAMVLGNFGDNSMLKEVKSVLNIKRFSWWGDKYFIRGFRFEI